MCIWMLLEYGRNNWNLLLSRFLGSFMTPSAIADHDVGLALRALLSSASALSTYPSKHPLVRQPSALVPSSILRYMP